MSWRSRLSWGSWLLGLSLVLLVYAFGMIVLNANRGLDITDESYYMLNVMQPEKITGSATNFGYALRPLYLIAGESIALYRVLGVIVLMLFSGFMGKSIFDYLVYQGLVIKDLKLGISMALVSMSLCLGYYSHYWLLTPSYNWLALLGGVLIVTGFLKLQTLCRESSRSWLIVLFISIGGFISFVAKPTTAVFLGIWGLFFIGVQKSSVRTWTLLLMSGAITVLQLLIFSVVAFGGVDAYIKQLKVGLYLGGLLEGGHSIALIFQGLIDSVDHFAHWVFHIDQTASASYGFLLLWLLMSGSFVIRGLIINSWHTAKIFNLSCFLMAASFAASIGTNNNLIQHASISILFMGLACVLCGLAFYGIKEKNAKNLIIVSPLLFLCISVYLIKQASQSPYRLPSSISLQNIPVNLINAKHLLYLDEKTAVYANDLMSLAKQSGWTTGMPLIDLTGASPGSLVILGGSLVGLPWLLGGYKGSGNFVSYALKNASSDVLINSWILTAPNGGQKIDASILEDQGLSIFKNKEIVGKLILGYRSEVQFLWRPIKDY